MFVEPIVQHVVQQEEVVIVAAPVQEVEPVAQPLPLMTEMELEEELVFEAEESHTQENDFFEKPSTFNCAVDSKDLDIPAFMRQKNE